MIIELVRPNDSTIELGSAGVTVAAGSGNESFSSYDQRGGGTFASQGTTSEGAAIEAGIEKCITRLFNNGSWLMKASRQFINCEVTVRWMAGANATVAAAFKQ